MFLCQITIVSDIRYQVTIDGVVLRVYLCADSLGAVTAFVDDFGSVFKPETEDMCVCIHRI
jgi:hypothetical protein